MGKLELYQVLNIVTNRTAPMYPQAEEMARVLNKPLEERTFLLRHLAYVRARDPYSEVRIRAWERARLIPAVIARLADRLDMAPGLERVVVEAGEMNIIAMMRHVPAPAAGFTVIERASEAFRQLPAEPGDFLLAEYWETLAARAATHADDPVRRLAVGDLIASLRIPHSEAAPELEGPGGALHRSRV
jgi:hypothetical protein